MRDYSKVSPTFWIGKTGKALRRQGEEALIVGMYLMTSPNSNMLGLYYLDLPTIAHQTGLGLEGATKGLQGAIEAGFCAYDYEAEVVWVHEMARYQIGDRLEPKDNQCKGVQKQYNDLPENDYLPAFYRKYASAFHMTQCRNIDSPLEAPSKPLRSQEQEQEQEQEQDQEIEQEQEQAQAQERKPFVEQRLDVAVHQAVAVEQQDAVEVIFAYWQKVMNSHKSVLDKDRRKIIQTALKSYSPADICKAIRGCSKSPHNMGQNDQKTKYNGLGLILRNAEKIDRFIQLDSNQAISANESLEQRNARIIAEVMSDVTETDDDTIEMEA